MQGMCHLCSMTVSKSSGCDKQYVASMSSTFSCAIPYLTLISKETKSRPRSSPPPRTNSCSRRCQTGSLFTGPFRIRIWTCKRSPSKRCSAAPLCFVGNFMTGAVTSGWRTLTEVPTPLFIELRKPLVSKPSSRHSLAVWDLSRHFHYGPRTLLAAGLLTLFSQMPHSAPRSLAAPCSQLRNLELLRVLKDFIRGTSFSRDEWGLGKQGAGSWYSHGQMFPRATGIPRRQATSTT